MTGVLSPSTASGVPDLELSAGRYRLKFVRTPEELDLVLRLRYRVFNLELHEGLDSAHHTGRDEDEFDPRFHHLMIEERTTGEVVGTYRMQTGEMAAAGGYYSGGLFEIEALPEPVLRTAVEVGRACVAKPHRTGRVLHLLWRGLAGYLAWNRKTRLFGCCSLTSQDQAGGTALHLELERRGAVHRSLRVSPRPLHRCEAPAALHVVPGIPALFQAYLDLGARALGPPAIDPEFKTIDWLVLLDVEELAPSTFRRFFA